jgi:hypothetical protein
VSEKLYSVFLSRGAAYTQEQEDFISAVEAHLKSHGCTPQTVGRSAFSIRQPVQAARDLIGNCDGAVVIAFERLRVLEALDKPGSPEESRIKNESHPTIWNQMEAAMAYGQRVPILTFIQSGLRRQGMLSDRLEWMALETDFSTNFLRTTQFQQTFGEWLALVAERRTSWRKSGIDPGELTIGHLLTQLKARQLWSVLVAVSAVAAAIFLAAFKAGQWFQNH